MAIYEFRKNGKKYVLNEKYEYFNGRDCLRADVYQIDKDIITNPFFLGTVYMRGDLVEIPKQIKDKIIELQIEYAKEYWGERL